MALFMDFHEDLKLPAEAIARIAEDTREARADQFGVRQVELYHNPEGKVYCLLEGPDEEAIRRHHAVLGVPCGDVHQVDSLIWREWLHRDQDENAQWTMKGGTDGRWHCSDHVVGRRS